MTTIDRGHLEKIHDDVHYYLHQVDGIRRMAKMTSGLCADEMGLGKTLEALTVAAIDFERGLAKRVLVVCLAGLKGNWADEIESFTSFTYRVLDGTARQRADQLAAFDADILIINYELLIRHVDELNEMGFDLVIYDEAHYMKNRAAARTKACLKLVAPRHWLLTGSPILNHVDDLWALLHRIAPSEFPNYWSFVNRYALFGGYKDKQIVGVKNEGELASRLGVHMIRRFKKDVLDLPEKQRIVVRVDLAPEQRRVYDEAFNEMKIELPHDPNPMEMENALVRFLRLKQICGTLACIEGYDDISFKLDRAVEMAEEIIGNGQSLVVFTQFRGVLRALDERLARAGIPMFQLHGDVPADKRVPIIKEWAHHQEHGRSTVLASMLQVGGIGLNMTAASKCFFLDKLFSPKLNEQAEDRLHRIGADKTQPVQIFEFLCRNTIESRIEQILRRKNKVFGSIVDTESSKWKKALIAAVLAGEEEEAA